MNTPHRFDVTSLDGTELLTMELRPGEDTAHLVGRRPMLRLSPTGPMGPPYVAPVETGRTSCRDANIANPPRADRPHAAVLHLPSFNRSVTLSPDLVMNLIAMCRETTHNPGSSAGVMYGQASKLRDFLQAELDRDLKPEKAVLQFHGGAFIDVLRPDPTVLTLELVAWHLSRKGRYNGATRRWYSIAEHSVHVSRCCDPADAREGLMHDAAEAVLWDVPNPLKISSIFAAYRELEGRWDAAVGERFGVRCPWPESVRKMDYQILGEEMRQLMWPDAPGAEEKWGDIPKQPCPEALVMRGPPVGFSDAGLVQLEGTVELGDDGPMYADEDPNEMLEDSSPFAYWEQKFLARAAELDLS